MTSLRTTARITGALYLLLAVAGGLGFLLVRPAIYVPDDAAATLAHLLEQESLARLGVTLELITVLSQSVLAIWFFKLFRSVNIVAATSVAAFGLVNAVAILASVAFSSTALAVALDPSLGGSAETVQLMYQIGGTFWGVGGIFFGLWLIPMGRLVLESRWMPRPLGWFLIAGGISYVISVFIGHVFGAPGVVVDALAVVASVGEFWMLGYLLIIGVRRGSVAPVEPIAEAARAS